MVNFDEFDVEERRKGIFNLLIVDKIQGVNKMSQILYLYSFLNDSLRSHVSLNDAADILNSIPVIVYSSPDGDKVRSKKIELESIGFLCKIEEEYD